MLWYLLTAEIHGVMLRSGGVEGSAGEVRIGAAFNAKGSVTKGLWRQTLALMNSEFKVYRKQRQKDQDSRPCAALVSLPAWAWDQVDS